MRQLKNALFICMLLAGMAGITAATHPVQASIREEGIPVSDSGTDNTLSGSNTGRKVVAASNGDIYAIYHGASGNLRFARSIDGGSSFQPSSMLDEANADADMTLDSEGAIYIAWVRDGVVKLTRSTDRRTTFSQPNELGNISSTTVHIAVDKPHVYLIEQRGTTLFVNHNNGVGDFTETVVDNTRVYADVHTDPLTGYVYAQTDDPNVLYFVSTDHGATFSSSVQPGADIYYSTSALSATALKKYLYVAGGTNGSTVSAAIRINLADHTSVTMPVSQSQNTTRRSLAADELGNVVSGFYSDGNMMLEASTDYGLTFMAPLTVASGSFLSAAINPANRDILALYEHSGGIYLTSYKNVLRSELAAEAAGASGSSMDPNRLALPRIADISFAINNGEAATNDSDVTLHIKAGPDVKSMALSNSAEFLGSSLQPLASSLDWNLCTTCQNGQSYTVFLKLYTASGQSLLLSRSIRYEKKAEAVSPATAETGPSKPSPLAIKPFAFLNNLKFGSRSSDVIKLQQYLNARGFAIAASGPGSAGQEVDYFGKATRKALQRFQAGHGAEILSPSGTRETSGVFGPATRAYVNSHP